MNTGTKAEVLKPGKLYVVATPIGNLADFSYRAVDILQQVELIAAEDTRHVKMLLQHYAISTRTVSLHQHNESRVASELVDDMREGASIALVSDAGTPLLSDPGLPLVRLARQHGIAVTPVPGACAMIAALSVAGVPVNRFLFEGFLPRTPTARKSFFLDKQQEAATWVFYESSHRIAAALEDMAGIIPAEREIVLARELTKFHETIVKDTLANVLALVKSDSNMRRGEFVVIVTGASAPQDVAVSPEERRVLTVLLRQCSVKTAVAMAAEITGQRRKLLYQASLEIVNDDPGGG